MNFSFAFSKKKNAFRHPPQGCPILGGWGGHPHQGVCLESHVNPPLPPTLGSVTLVCDTSTQIGPFRAKRTQKYSTWHPKSSLKLQKRFKDLCFVFERFSLKCSNFVNFWARKTFFFFKQVRISPEIDWYHYQSANAAPNGIVRHRIKTDQFSRSVTSEPTVPPPSPAFCLGLSFSQHSSLVGCYIRNSHPRTLFTLT